MTRFGIRQTSPDDPLGAWLLDGLVVLFLGLHVAILSRKGKWDFVRTDENGQLNVRIPIQDQQGDHLIDTLERHFQSEPLGKKNDLHRK